MNTKSIKVFDRGEDGGIDRYTIFPYLYDDDTETARQYLGTCSTGRGVSMWGELLRCDLETVRGAAIGQVTFLGECVAFDSLPEQLQKHIVARLEG